MLITRATAMKIYNILSSLLIIQLLNLPGNRLYGQGQDKLTLEEIFLEQKFETEHTGVSNWMPDGNSYIKAGPSKDMIYITNARSNIADTVVKLDDIIVQNDNNSRIGAFYVSDDGKMTLIEVIKHTKENISYRYFFKRLGTDNYVEMIAEGIDKRLMNPSFSPDNNLISFIYKSNIYVYDISTGESDSLTNSGSKHIINGNSGERFASILNTIGYKWSPDSKKIAFIRFNTNKIGVFRMINNTNSIYPEVVEFQHAKPGTALPEIKLIVSNIDDKSEVVIYEGPTKDFSYIRWFGWIERDELIVKRLNREQNHLSITKVNIYTGLEETIWTDRDKAFLMPFNMFFTKEKLSFLALSEKDSWRHLYVVDTNTGNEVCITNGDYDVEKIAGIDPEKDIVYFIASPENAIYRYLYKVSLLDGEDPVRISPDQKGVHTYNISPGGRYAFHGFSSMNTPPVTTFVDLYDHTVLSVLQNNQKLKDKLSGKLLSRSQFIKIDIGDSILLDAWWIKPPDFDPTKKYPLITHVYSMPANAVVQDRWMHNNYLWYQLMAQKGFIVMNIDSRGTPSLYGRDWRKCIYLKHGILPSDDHALAVKKLISDYSFIDSTRIGICGWSGGGLLSLLQIFRYPELYKVAIPGAYISNHRFYSAGFTERFLGSPQNNPEAYELTAAINYADGLKGDLLLIHGTGDDNVHYQNTEALINKLVDEKKRFFVIPYPNRSHNIKNDRETYFHLYDMYTWFFANHLGTGTNKMNSE